MAKTKRNINIPPSSKKVEGVLIKNNEIRNQLIMMGQKYSQYKENFAPMIGESYNIRTFTPDSNTGGSDLYDYTFDNENDYSKSIVTRYLNGTIDKISKFGLKEVVPDDTINVYGQEADYVDYFSTMYNFPTTVFDKINGLLAHIDTSYALAENTVGVIDDLKVGIGLTGEITTNPNSYKNVLTDTVNWIRGKGKIGESNKDTPIGVLTSGFYPRHLYKGAEFASTRNRDDARKASSYITPSLARKYGNNLATVFGLSDILYIDSRIGRTRDDLGIGITIGDEKNYGKNYITSISDNAHLKLFGLDQLNFKAQRGVLGDIDRLANENSLRFFYTPQKNYQYYSSDGQGIIENDDVYHASSLADDVLTVQKRIHHLMYDEGEDLGTLPEFGGVQTDENGDLDWDAYHAQEDEYQEKLNKLSGANKSVIHTEEFDVYEVVPNTEFALGKNNLFEKTRKLFASHKIGSMVARYHSDPNLNPNGTAQTTSDAKFGLSKGRNLKVLDADFKERIDLVDNYGYENPYCRTWNFHHEYSRYIDTIRPFKRTALSSDNEYYAAEGAEDSVLPINDMYKNELFNQYKARFKGKSFNITNSNGTTGSIRIGDGSEYMTYDSSINENGVIISPTDGMVSSDTGEVADKHRYMLSIENLAWKDYARHPHLSNEQIGPNGGRIMWFPPYDLDFHENVTANWQGNDFIGRGEKVYTYANTDRTAQLSFSILIDHPSVLNSIVALKKGEGEENDINADILRFFAGCHIPWPTPPPPEEVPEEKPKPKPKVPEKGKLKFVVFFPNNYSGNAGSMEDNSPFTGDDTDYSNLFKPEKNFYCADDDWAEYLLAGDCVRFDKMSGATEDDEMTSSGGTVDDPVTPSGGTPDDSTTPVDTTPTEPVPDPDTVPQSATETPIKGQQWHKLKVGANYNIVTPKDEMKEVIFEGLWGDILKQIGNDKVVTYGGIIEENGANVASLTYKNKKGETIRYTFKGTNLPSEYLVPVDSSIQGTNATEEYTETEFTPIDEDDYSDYDFSAADEASDRVINGQVITSATTVEEAFKNFKVGQKYYYYGNYGQENAPIHIPYWTEILEYKGINGGFAYFEDKNGNKYGTLADGANEFYYIMNFDEDNPLYKHPASGGTYIGYEVREDGIGISYHYCDKEITNEPGIENVNYINTRDYGKGKTTKNSGKANTGHAHKLKKREKPKYIYYRNDFDLRQWGIGEKNFKDCKSFGLNVSAKKVKEQFPGLKVASDDSVKVFSFADVYIGVDQASGSTKSHKADQNVVKYLSGMTVTHQEDIAEVKRIFSKFKGHMKVKTTGFATRQDKGNSATLAKRRGNTVAGWLKKMFEINEEDIDITVGNPKDLSQADMHTTNTVGPKSQRCCVIEVSYAEPEDETAGNTDEAVVDANGNNAEDAGVSGTTVSSDGEEIDMGNGERVLSTITVKAKANNVTDYRYDDEYRFFKNLSNDRPLMYKQLKDKFKYFDPAFHSMTPEGFNARLNFLHQCTRQGKTGSASDSLSGLNYANMAGNVAFGRMPVCVIRIGDLIYSRAIIQSLDINYSEDGMQWDMNLEGAGLQPMYAKVTMGLVLLGGSSMTGPISRLQNAQTFNYYANTGIYDNRADRIRFIDGKIAYTNLFDPNT